MSSKGIKMDPKKKTIEDTYQKMDHHEHVLKLPDSYVGGVEEDIQKTWVFDRESRQMIFKNIKYVPGLYKIFDEVIVNARDHTVRDNTCKMIRVDINKEKGSISVYNDGNKGIPVALHVEYDIYVPELIFGVLLTSGNYNQKGKTVGGKNGYGAKLANIFSTEFVIEVIDNIRKIKYTQRYTDNMYKKEDAVMQKIGRGKSSTKITFFPDFKRFGIDGLTDDIISLFEKRVYDVAACTRDNVDVYLNGELLKIKDFRNYIDMFYEDKEALEKTLIYEQINDRWAIGLVYDPTSGFRHVSYVNGISTSLGGSHVDHIMTQIINGLVKGIKTKNKNINIKNAYIRDNLTLFAKVIIEDPAFTSQTKDILKNRVASFGSRCDVTDDFIKKLAKTGIENEVVNFAKIKALAGLKSSDGKKIASIKGLEKLDEAKWAGKRKAKLCTLILTEGDSAKNFAVAGKELIGNERYGVFPLKGKLLNVREATAKQLLNNEEIKHIKQIMGLKQNKKYDENNINELRYGSILILTDQDADGSHIKGLVMNFIHYFWPSLLTINGFIQSMATPIIKAWKKTDLKKNNVKIFYTLTEYNNWKKNVKINLWKVKYFKGLGTHTSKEAKQCFNDFENRTIRYIWSQDDNSFAQKSNISLENKLSDADDNGEEDYYDRTSKCYGALLLAFSKIQSNERKTWLSKYDKENIIENDQTNISYYDFVHKDLIHFSNYDTIRSIPSICDGFKPSQRKILYGAILRKIFKDEIRVSQLAGFVSDKAAYHHGEASLQGAIINMAQDFPGSNNINLLFPSGDFGNRRQGGKNHASPRYIHTLLNELTPLLFRKSDECIYNYVDDDGQEVEPVTYSPILPIILINGSHGIGTGYSTTVPCYNPSNIINNIKRLLKNEEPIFMYPWYKGFTGIIRKLNNRIFQTCGKYEVIDENTIVIKELPVGLWTEDYFKFLDTLVADDSKNSVNDKIIKEWEHDCGTNSINITITFTYNALQKLEKSGEVMKKMKLYKNVGTTNMNLYDTDGKIKIYETPIDILKEYKLHRLNMYDKRKEYHLRYIKNQLDLLVWKIKFLEFVISGKIIVFLKNKAVKKSVIITKLEELNFPKLNYNIGNNKEYEKTYSYITSVSLFALTEEELEKLRQEKDVREAEYIDYKNTTIETMWMRELDEFEKAYNKWLSIQEDYDNIPKNNKKKTVNIKKQVGSRVSIKF
jgi:DNA topoisomerase-2